MTVDGIHKLTSERTQSREGIDRCDVQNLTLTPYKGSHGIKNPFKGQTKAILRQSIALLLGR